MRDVTAGDWPARQVGDSRLVLARRQDGKLVGEELTVDHKPSDEAPKGRVPFEFILSRCTFPTSVILY